MLQHDCAAKDVCLHRSILHKIHKCERLLSLFLGCAETVVSNERLHAALTAPTFRLFTALAQQIAGVSDTGDRQRAAGQPSGNGSGSVRMSSSHRAEGMQRAQSADSATRVNLCVMEGVQEDAYSGCGAPCCTGCCT